MPGLDSPGFIKIDKLSEAIGVPMPTLRRWERNESMPPSLRFGGRIRYWKVTTLKRWLATLDTIPESMQAEVWEGLQAAAIANNVNENQKDKS